MKRLNKKASVVGVLIAFLLTFAVILPAQLPAQDIDDVIEGLDRNFTIGGKEDVKRDNIDAANEQNREDVQIQRDQVVGQSITITYSAMTTSHIQVNYLSVLGQQIPINSEENVIGMGTETAIFQWTAPLQAGLTFPLFVSVTCLTGSCEVSAGLSGVVNGINLVCTPISTGFISAPSTVLAGPSTCTTS